jgi:hypothetical protein
MSNVNLTWADPTTLSDGTTAIPAGEFSGVAISRSPDGVNFTALAQVLPGVQAYQDANVPPGSYVYQAVATDSANAALNSSAATVSITVPVPAEALAPVTNLAAALA